MQVVEIVKTIALWIVLLGTSFGLVYYLSHASWFSWRTVFLMAGWIAAGSGLWSKRSAWEKM